MRLTRKEKFRIALKNAGITQEEWRSTYYMVSRVHLSQVFNGKKPLKGPLRAAIDRFIAQYLAGDPWQRFHEQQAKKRKGRS